MQRALRDTLKKCIPGPVRAYIKRRCEAHFIDPVSASLKVEQTQQGCRCVIDEAWSFLAPVACLNDLTYFTTDRSGRSEFYGLARRARQGGTMFDIGANCGLISALHCAAQAQNRAYAFEPSPLLCKRLEEIRDLNGFGDRLKIEQVGIGETRGTLEMLIDPWGGFVQTQHFDQSMWTKPEKLVVQLESIADSVTRLGVRPDVIKLDIEGYEYEAIKGARDYLAKYQPACFVELHLSYLQQRNLSPRTVVEMLESCGYRFSTYGGKPLTAHSLHSTLLANIHFLVQK